MAPHMRPTTPSLQSFFDEAAQIIGEANISRTAQHGALNGPQGQQNYGDPFSSASHHQPSGAVRPRTVEEVQAMVRLANTHKVCLWTVSRGKNLGYGGSSPVVKGCIVLDLHRMNQIIEVNEEAAYAVVEPGVSFFDLYEEIQRRGLKLWPSVPAIGWGSVLGNTLDRGFGYTPNGEHSQSQCGMEVVLPDGELLRTGMGAMNGNKMFALYKGGFGPGLDGLFYQSNLGVVTKLGIHITPAPEAYAIVEVSVPRENDLIPLIDTLSDLMRRSIILNSPSIANIFRIALTSQIPEIQAKLAPYMNPNAHVPYPILDDIRITHNLPFWKAHFSLYGSVEMLPALIKTIQRAFSPLIIPGIRIQTREFPGLPNHPLNAATDIKQEEIPHSGIPTLAPLSILHSRGQSQTPCGHIDYSPILPPSGRDLYEWYLTAKQRIADAAFDFFADFHVYPRYVTAIALVIFAPGEEVRVNELYRTLAADGARMGYIVYRTHVSFMDDVAGELDFNNGVFGRVMTRLKDMLDPNAVLSPGKSGIWNSGERLGVRSVV